MPCSSTSSPVPGRQDHPSSASSYSTIKSQRKPNKPLEKINAVGSTKTTPDLKTEDENASVTVTKDGDFDTNGAQNEPKEEEDESRKTDTKALDPAVASSKGGTKSGHDTDKITVSSRESEVWSWV